MTARPSFKGSECVVFGCETLAFAFLKRGCRRLELRVGGLWREGDTFVTFGKPAADRSGPLEKAAQAP